MTVTTIRRPGDRTMVAQYLWGNGLVRCNGEYPMTDGRVNVRLSTNATQQVTSTNQPDAFGIGSVTSGTASAYSYGGAVGYRQDGIAAAGLPGAYAFQKVGARYYDPTFGAFLTRDIYLSQKPYAYCDGDPVNFDDPSGHKAKKNPPHNDHGQNPGGAPNPGGPVGKDGGGSGGTGGGTATTSGANSPANNGGNQVNITINFPSPDEVLKGIKDVFHKIFPGKGGRAMQSRQEEKLLQYFLLSSHGE